MNVLILSKDRTILTAEGAVGDARDRHVAYLRSLQKRAPGSQIRIIVLASHSMSGGMQDVVEGLRLYPTRSASRIFYLLSTIRTAREVMRDGWRPDVLSGQELWEEGLAMLLLRLLYGGKVVTQLHFDIFSREWLRESALNRVKYWIARIVARSSNVLRVVSTPLRVLVTERWGIDESAVRVAPVGVTLAPGTPAPEGFINRVAPQLKGRQIVLFVGRLCEAKNLSDWMAIAGEVARIVPDSGFLVVGDGPLRSEVEALADRSGLSGRIAFTGMLPYWQVADAFCASRVFLLTSHYEGFGRVVLEAMLCGVPVVSTRCLGPEDLVVDGVTGYLIDRGDRSRAVECVVRLLSDESVASRFSIVGRNRAREDFSVEALADRVVQCWIAA